jgi:chemotaxis protein MotB
VTALDRGRGDLEAQLAEAEKTRATILADLDARRARVAELEAEVAKLTEAATSAQSSLQELNAEGSRRSNELADLTGQLGKAEERYQTLNAQVTALDPYRQTFIEDVRSAIGNLPGVSVDGHAVVLETDHLFVRQSPWGGFSRDGQARLDAVAASLQAVSADMPSELDWQLIIEGHTDDRRMSTSSAYRNNWELSADRAVAIVDYLMRQGVSGEHLYAVGRADIEPLVPNTSAEARQQNRRIELMLATVR